MNLNTIARLIHSKAEALQARGYSVAITAQTADDVQVSIYNNHSLVVWKRWSFGDDFGTDLQFRLDSILRIEKKPEAPKTSATFEMRNELVVAQAEADYAGLLQDNTQYLNNILEVACSIRKPCYAVRLVQYIDNTFPVNIHNMYRLRFNLLKEYCNLMRGTICTEDGIQPAISVINLLTIESIDHPTVASLNCMIAAQYDIILTGAYMDSKCSYADFCDHYAHILNR